jgi:hypothetical protein
LRFYGIDLLDLYRGRLSLRRLAVLVRQLPPESATVRALTPEAAWSTTDYLLAAVLDAARWGNWLTVETNKRKGAKNPRPLPVPRPGDPVTTRTPPRKIGGHELAEWLGKVG